MFLSFLFGVVLTSAIGLITMLMFKKGSIKIFIAFLSMFITIVSIYSGITGKVDSNILNSILSFFGSFIFAWILTEYTTKNEYKEHQKSISIRSFRHTLKLNKQIEETINCIEKMLKEYDVCTHSSGVNSNKCGLANQLTLTTSMLKLIKKQVSANLDDWSDEFAKELENVKEVIRYKQLAIITDPEMLVDLNGNIDKEACLSLIKLNKQYLKARDKLKGKVPDYMYNFLNEEEFIEPLQGNMDFSDNFNGENLDRTASYTKDRIKNKIKDILINEDKNSMNL